MSFSNSKSFLSFTAALAVMLLILLYAPSIQTANAAVSEDLTDRVDEIDEDELKEIDEHISDFFDLDDEFQLERVSESTVEDDVLFLTYERGEVELSINYHLELDQIQSLSRRHDDVEDLARITLSEAEEKAIEQLEDLFPDLVSDDELDLDPHVKKELDNDFRGPQYRFFFQRLHQDIPVQGDGITIGIDAVNGKLSEMRRDFTVVEKFHDLDQSEAISQKNAESILKEQLPLQLIYRQPDENDYDDSTDDHTDLQSPELYYTFAGQMIVDDQVSTLQQNYLVDAVDEEVINSHSEHLDQNSYDNMITSQGELDQDYLETAGFTKNEFDYEDLANQDASQDTNQNANQDEDQNSEYEHLINLGEASLQSVGLEEYEMESISEVQVGRRAGLQHLDEDQDIYRLEFSAEFLPTGQYVDIFIDPDSTQVVNLDLPSRSVEELDKDDMASFWEEFADVEEKVVEHDSMHHQIATEVSQSFPTGREDDLMIVNETIHSDIVEDTTDYPVDLDPGRLGTPYYSLNVVNNIPIDNVGENILLDKATGMPTRITGYWQDYIDHHDHDELLTPEDIELTLQEARELLIDEMGVTLSYVPENEVVDSTIVGEREQEISMQPAYQLEEFVTYDGTGIEAPYIHGDTGEIYQRDGSSYGEVFDVEDMIDDSHWASDYMELALAQEFLTLRNGELAPDEDITEEELNEMLIGAGLISEDEQEAEDEQELTDEEYITRLDKAKQIVKILGYQQVADDNLNYPLNYQDTQGLNREEKNWVAISSITGIMEGDGTDFSPDENLTRAEALALIFRISEYK